MEVIGAQAIAHFSLLRLAAPAICAALTWISLASAAQDSAAAHNITDQQQSITHSAHELLNSFEQRRRTTQ